MKAGGKQVDILISKCPETGKKVAIEVCVSTHTSEPDQAMRNLAAGADHVLVVGLNKSDLTQLSREFLARFGQNIDPRIKLCMPADLAEAPTFRHIYDCPSLVYERNWDKPKKGKKS